MDISTKENELVYVRICGKGEVGVFFAKKMAMKKANTTGIYKAISKAVLIDSLEQYLYCLW